jgi:tetratricopeptide (TPR) repeat protein
VAYSTQRPSTAVSTASNATSGLAAIIPALLTAVEDEGDYVQDAFQATICLGWLHYVLDEPGLAIARLPKDFAAVATKLEGQSLSGWARVCIVKGAFLKGSSLERTGSAEDAIPSYSSIIPWLSTKPFPTESLQFKMWTEHLLVRLCHLFDQSLDANDYKNTTDALQAYRFWAKYWEGTAKTGGTEGANAARYRRLAWKAYYDSLSIILRHDLPYETDAHTADPAVSEKQFGASNTKLQQRAELKKVEAIYESLLLKETHFPKASENNTEIEQWVDAVIENWRFVCGPRWSEADLGEGGKEAVGRGVLDVSHDSSCIASKAHNLTQILYRAATKTFHSTQILRHLFVVHAALADFDLAFKAYESYVEIITRGKDRAQHSGEEDVGIDDDSTILRTSALAITVLCRFGSAKEAEKALEIGNNIEKWLEQSEDLKSSASEAGSIHSVETYIEPTSLASAYCAIGISHAHWARFTYDADSRSSLQARAVQYLRKSLAAKLEAPNNIEALYALALLLAEMRDIPGAIQIVKRALSPTSKQSSSMGVDGVITPSLTTDFGRERKLIPMWHLLALLLTSRSEYSAAERACEAAFEQFGDPAILFGKEDVEAYRSEHLNQAGGKNSNLGIIDQMESFEKSGVLQVKMTQLSLLEVGDGPAAAVDGCDELLALYARLFGEVATALVKPQPTTAMPPPKSAVGTIRGSIFRSRGSMKNPQNHNRDSSVASSAPSTIATQATTAPAIQVTDEDGSNGHLRHRLSHHKHPDEQGGVQRSPSKLQKRSANSLRRRSEMQADYTSEVPDLQAGVSNGTSTRNSTVQTKTARRASVSSSTRKSTESNERSLRPIAHNMSHTSEPPPVGHVQQPPKQDVRLPAPFPDPYYIPPDPYFSKVQSRRQKISLLVSIWIYISGLYSRADMLNDAKDAVREAFKLVEMLESEVAQESSTSKAFASRGWGGGKSVEELWADVYTAVSQFGSMKTLYWEHVLT